MRFAFKIGLVLAGLMAVAFEAQAEQRVALVIGNAGYKHATALRNTINDANAMADKLKDLGFTVDLATDQDGRAMRETIRSFGTRAGKADVALVFYAGHGMEMDGRNYLIPIDAQLKSDIDLEYEAVPLQLLMRTVEAAKRMRIVILDACRNNPFAAQMTIAGRVTRRIDRGLAKIEPGTDTLVAYAAKDGTVAEDGPGRHSNFTSALLQHLDTPRLEIGLLFRRVRDTVLSSTDRRQEPFTYGSIGGQEFYLNDGTRRPESPRVSDPAPSAGRTQQIELAFCTGMKDSTDAATVQNYLDQFPNGMCASLARTVLAKLGPPWPRQGAALFSREPDPAPAQGARAVGESRVTSTSPVEQPARNVVASRQADEAPQASAADSSKLARDLQGGLKRVGCYSGTVDGKWTAKGKDALKEFVRYSKVSLSIDEPTVTALDAVTAKTERVCPLECDSDETEVNGRCVSVSKPSKPRQQSAEPAPRQRIEPKIVVRRAEPRESREDMGSKKLCWSSGRMVLVRCDDPTAMR